MPEISQDLTDIELITQIQTYNKKNNLKERDKLFIVLNKRYTQLSNSAFTFLFHNLPNAHSIEPPTLKSDIVLLMYKACMTVKFERVTDITKFRFSTIFWQYIKAYKSVAYKRLKIKKHKPQLLENIDNYENKIELRSSQGYEPEYIYENKSMNEEFLPHFMNTITEKEAQIVKKRMESKTRASNGKQINGLREKFLAELDTWSSY